MDCIKCGHVLDLDYDYCYVCGEKIPKAAVSKVFDERKAPKAKPRKQAKAQTKSPKQSAPSPVASHREYAQEAAPDTSYNAPKKSSISVKAAAVAPAPSPSVSSGHTVANTVEDDFGFVIRPAKEKINIAFDSTKTKARKAADLYKDLPKDSKTANIIGAAIAIAVAIILMFVGSLDIKGFIRKHQSVNTISYEVDSGYIEHITLPF